MWFFWSLSQLQAEAGRLEELKIKNMQNVIEAIRAEIALFWERCYYSAEQRQAFVPYFDGNINILVCVLYPSVSYGAGWSLTRHFAHR